MKFTCDMFHPNIFADGRVCISILHAPGDDPMGYELSAERWSPVQSVEKILLSVVSMLAGEYIDIDGKWDIYIYMCLLQNPTTRAEPMWMRRLCGGSDERNLIALHSVWCVKHSDYQLTEVKITSYYPQQQQQQFLHTKQGPQRYKTRDERTILYRAKESQTIPKRTADIYI